MDKPDLYSKYTPAVRGIADVFFARFGSLLKEIFQNNEISLLDIGSGCGTVLSQVTVKQSRLKFSKVIGVDKSLDMIKFSSEKYGNELISFQYMDVEGEIPEDLQNQQFEAVTSFYCLYWVKDLQKALKNIYNLMKPGGIFCCVFLLKSNFSEMYRMLASKFPEYMENWKDTFTPLWHEDHPDAIIRNDFAECGFEILEFWDDQDYQHQFSTIDDVIEFFKSIEPFSKSMPDDVKMEYFKEAKKSCLSLLRDEDIIIHARKLRTVVRKPLN